ncbi:MAG: zinc ribbon domain-containing protein, partial [Betaproteobacteria bacterium]|nr:zinc ribbon domain-containing protein [Betaproteobacteria bacterium]
ELFNLAYDRTDADNFITLRFKTAQRFVHVEFYDPLATSTPDRRYTYVWPGDLVVDQLSVRVQEPAAASNVSVQPDLGAGFAGPDGLLYRTAALGALKAGRQLPIEIRYTKTDSRTSSEILKLNAPESTSQAATGSVQGVPGWLLVLAVAAALAVGAGVASLWWHWRKKTSGAQPGDAAFCPQCGSRLASGDRFCSKCGAPVRES